MTARFVHWYRSCADRGQEDNGTDREEKVTCPRCLRWMARMRQEVAS